MIFAIISKSSANVNDNKKENNSDELSNYLNLVADSISPDTGDVELDYPFQDESNYPVDNFNSETSGLQLGLPSNITSQVVFDPLTGQYVFSQKIGDINYRLPSSMTIEEYQEYDHVFIASVFPDPEVPIKDNEK